MKFSAVLIAGGKSKRFGEDKAFALWQGEPLWRHQIRKLESLGPSEVLVSCREEQNFPDNEDFSRVHDSVEDRGPLAGLATCLKRASEPLSMVLAVDLPMMPTEFLTSILEKAKFGQGVVTRWENGFWEPLAAIYPTIEVAEIANRRLKGDDLSLQGMVSEAFEQRLISEIRLTEKEVDWFVNWNSREDLPSGGE
ncbi:MAG: molybdenum cofactor guanylyltransferase [Verrucomicrobiota bacterium]